MFDDLSLNASDYIEVAPRQYQQVDKDGEPFGPVIGLHDPSLTLDAYLVSIAVEPKRQVFKSVIVSRLIAADKIAAAKAALGANPAAFARWFASDRPAVNFDDPDAIALLKAIGADPDKILAS